MDRRQFAGTVGAAWVAGLRLPFDQPSRLLPRVGLQLYTVRRAMAENVEATLDAVAGIGIAEVEFAGYFGRTPAAIKAALAHSGLAAPSAHLRSELFTPAYEAELTAAAEIGHQRVLVAWVPPAQRKTLDDIHALAATLNRVGETCKARGLGFGYHNHDFEFTSIEGTLPYEILLKETDPALVSMQLDLFWVANPLGAGAPAEYLRRWPGRYTSVHAKDMDADGNMVDVGSGTLDFKAILAAGGASIRHVYIEHDEPKDAMASVRNGYEYLRKL